MRKILVSTNNKNKIKEIKEILSDLPVEVYSKSDLGVADFDVIEDGNTLDDNSIIKVKALRDYGNFTDYIIIADDSGLFVDALDGDPGVHSARYAGEDGNDELNNKLLLENMKNIVNRKAAFKSTIAILDENNNISIVQGECRGRILEEKSGDNGFGYDPLFAPDGFEESFAELDGKRKNEISHRGKALEEFKKYLEEKLEA